MPEDPPIIDVTDFEDVTKTPPTLNTDIPVMAGLNISRLELENNSEPEELVKLMRARLGTFRRTIEAQLVAAGLDLPDDFDWTAH
jgi:hypothetical protein